MAPLVPTLRVGMPSARLRLVRSRPAGRGPRRPGGPGVRESGSPRGRAAIEDAPGSQSDTPDEPGWHAHVPVSMPWVGLARMESMLTGTWACHPKRGSRFASAPIRPESRIAGAARRDDLQAEGPRPGRIGAARPREGGLLRVSGFAKVPSGGGRRIFSPAGGRRGDSRPGSPRRAWEGEKETWTQFGRGRCQKLGGPRSPESDERRGGSSRSCPGRGPRTRLGGRAGARYVRTAPATGTAAVPSGVIGDETEPRGRHCHAERGNEGARCILSTTHNRQLRINDPPDPLRPGSGCSCPSRRP